MRYAILVYEGDADFAKRNDPVEAPAYWAAWMAYTQALNEGVTVTGGAPLEPPALATTIRTKKGQRLVEDGPFAASKEQLAGFYLIDVANVDVALERASRCPAASSGAVEVRPILVRSMEGAA